MFADALTGHGVTFKAGLHGKVVNHAATRPTLDADLGGLGFHGADRDADSLHFHHLRNIFRLRMREGKCRLWDEW